MGMKPQILAYFEEGVERALGYYKGFVSTWNWLLGFVSNLKGGKGVKVDYQDTDHPEITLNLEAGEGIKIEESGDAMKISSESQSAELEFKSAADSNVVVTQDGNEVTIGVYYS